MRERQRCLRQRFGGSHAEPRPFYWSSGGLGCGCRFLWERLRLHLPRCASYRVLRNRRGFWHSRTYLRGHPIYVTLNPSVGIGLNRLVLRRRLRCSGLIQSLFGCVTMELCIFHRLAGFLFGLHSLLRSRPRCLGFGGSIAVQLGLCFGVGLLCFLQV